MNVNYMMKKCNTSAMKRFLQRNHSGKMIACTMKCVVQPVESVSIRAYSFSKNKKQEGAFSEKIKVESEPIITSIDNPKVEKMQEIKISTIYVTQDNQDKLLSRYPKKEICEFVNKSLGEYSDGIEAITKCVEFALSSEKGKGGSILVAEDENSKEIVGCVIMNNTNKSVYHPELFLGYIGTSEKVRGKGLGKKLIEQIIEEEDGDICLHVDHDNPAIRLYERMGFENKYYEMRFSRSDNKE